MNTSARKKKIDMDEVVTRRILAEELLIFGKSFEAKIDIRFKEQAQEYRTYVDVLREDSRNQIADLAKIVLSWGEDRLWVKELLSEHSELHKQTNFRLNDLEA